MDRLPFVTRSLCAMAAAALVSLPAGAPAADQPPLKIGVVVSYTGPDAVGGQEFDGGVATWIKQHGDVVAGRKLQFIKRDTGGPSPDVAKRLAQELVVQDGVDMIVGIDYTPTAVGVGTISTQAKKPVFIMNAATSGILKNAPYMVRFGNLTAQVEAPFGTWAAKNGVKSVYALFADYGPGVDAKNAFERTFTAGGGKVLGDIGVQISTSEFSSYVQRMKDAKPDAVFVFLPLGPQARQFFKAWSDAGMAKAGIKLIGNGDLTDETDIDTLGENVAGVVTAYTYSDAHPSPVNRAFLAAWRSATGGKLRPDAFAVSAYDSMAALYRAIGQQGGKVDPERTIALVRGLRLDSPRGPLEIDPETREPIQNVYLRRVEKRNGRYENVEFDTIPMVKDPNSTPK